MNHASHLTKLSNLIVKETPADKTPSYEMGFYSGRIPNEFLSQEMIRSEKTSLILDGEEARMFRESVKMLRNDIRNEYLKDGELKDRLWVFICEIWSLRAKYKDAKELKIKINSFIEGLCKPLEEYEIIFKVENLKINKRTRVADSLVVNYSAKALRKKGFAHSNKDFPNSLEDFANQSLVLVTEKGNNSSLVIERARNKSREIVSVLQTYLSEMSSVANEQLLFEISVDYAIRNKTHCIFIGAGWYRGFSPIVFDYDSEFSRLTKKANKHDKLIRKAPKSTLR